MRVSKPMGLCIAFTWNFKLWIFSIPFLILIGSDKGEDVFFSDSGFRLIFKNWCVNIKVNRYRFNLDFKVMFYGKVETKIKILGDVEIRTSDGDWLLEHRVCTSYHRFNRKIIKELETYYFKVIPTNIDTVEHLRELECRNSPIEAINSYPDLLKIMKNFH